MELESSFGIVRTMTQQAMLRQQWLNIARELHRSGWDPGLERAAVGRRLSESEIDILLLLEELQR